MLALFLACTTEQPAAPAPEAPPADPPAEAAPAPEAPTVQAQIAPPERLDLPPPTSRDGQLLRIERLKARCEQDCARLIASAGSETLPVESREMMWWALSAAEVSDEVRAEIEAAIDMPAAPPQLWRAMAENLRHTASGQATLAALMREGEQVELRAAAACGMLSVVPMESWRDYPLDAAATEKMGICATPWKYGQVEAPGAPG